MHLDTFYSLRLKYISRTDNRCFCRKGVGRSPAYLAPKQTEKWQRITAKGLVPRVRAPSGRALPKEKPDRANDKSDQNEPWEDGGDEAVESVKRYTYANGWKHNVPSNFVV